MTIDVGAMQTPSNLDSESADDDSDKPDKTYFDKEVEETFRRAVSEGVQQDHVILEVNALRLAYNMQFSDCAGALFHGIMNLALEAAHDNPVELLRNTNSVLTRWKDLLKRYLNSEDDEVEVLLRFEEICLESGKEFAPIFSKILEVFYEKDIVSEEAILSWATEKEEADESDKVFVKQSEAFIHWLREASEEEEEDEEEA
uniref:Translation initiation factor eIF2B subunit epsilon n=1 Tax=Araucaria cunninghamii TaxID=56994 RepID=A0A0D6R6T7_ARACU